MNKFLKVAGFTLLTTAFMQLSVMAKTYYVDSINGNDLNNGTSQENAWQSLSKINSTIFNAGDEIYFKKGCSWDGSIELQGDGEFGNTIKVSSYGDGEKPIINGNQNSTIKLTDRSYWEISDLKITNRNTTEDIVNKSGVFVVAKDKNCYGISITDIEVTEIDGSCSTFSNAGIYALSQNGFFNGLHIENNYIHDLKTIGIYLISYDDIVKEYNNDVIVRGNKIERNGRDGIIVTHAQNPLIEKNVLLHIGTEGVDLNWIAGIFPTRCKDGIIQYNEVGYIVETGDSYAYDLDVGCEGTFYYQYNYSHDNAGGFYMQPKGALKKDTDKSVVRYNVSINERGGVRIQNPHVEMYNNVFYDAENGLEIGTSYTGGQSDVEIYNNVFVSPAIPEYWYEFDFHNNLYYGHEKYYTGATEINSETGKKQYKEFDISTLSSKHENSLIADPEFVSDVVLSPDDCKLKDSSPAIGKGIATPDVLKDYFGNIIFSNATDIGAYSSSVVNVINADGELISRVKSTIDDTTQKKEKVFYATDYNTAKGVTKFGNKLTSCDNGDWVCYKDIDFGTGMYNMFIKSAVDDKYAGKSIKVKIDSIDSKSIGTLKMDGTNGWNNFKWNIIPLSNVSGVHDVYISFGDVSQSGAKYVNQNLYGVGIFSDIIIR